MDPLGKSLLLLNSLPVSAWGISELPEDFRTPPKAYGAPSFVRAITLLQAYTYPLEKYNPSDFHSFLANIIKPALDDSAGRISLFFQENGFSSHTVSNIREDPAGLIGEFSQKRAAVRAGLGWIGKNTLLVHPKFGPRVRISTILTSLEIPVHYSEWNGPSVEDRFPKANGSSTGESSQNQGMSGCGGCDVCVQSCPSKCLKGAEWKPGLDRSELINISFCRERNDAKPGCICGVCLLACPIGKDMIGYSGRLIKR